MRKNIVFAGVGLLLISSPLFVAAQTTTTSNASLIATLTALVQTLENELQQLLAGHSSSSTPTQQTTAVTTSTTPSGCSTFANLQKGATDATTNGEVTQLQQFVGISPTTGYYGAQTSIAYQNKCGNLSNSQPTSVASMTEYTDSNFGFSFWYPSGWTVITAATPSNQYAGGTITKELDVSNTTGPIGIVGGIAITEFISTSTSIIDSPEGSGACGSDSCNTTEYFFDTNTGQWMRTFEIGQTTTATLVDVSQNTMGGLHMITGTARWGCDTIIPLSAQRFVVVTSEDCSGDGSIFGAPQSQLSLAKTIVATNPAVAIPVPTAQQTATIQAEASAYGVNTSNSANTATVTDGDSAQSSATIDQNSLSGSTLTGTATGLSQVTVTIYNYTPANMTQWTAVQMGTTVPVVNGKWSYNIGADSGILPGAEVIVSDPNNTMDQLATGNLTAQ